MTLKFLIINLQLLCNGQFQKISIPYHGQLFRIPEGKGVLWTGNPKAWGDTYNWNSEGMGGGGLDLGFPQETDKSAFLENANFMDF